MIKKQQKNKQQKDVTALILLISGALVFFASALILLTFNDPNYLDPGNPSHTIIVHSLSLIALFIGILILGYAWFIFFERQMFYKRWNVYYTVIFTLFITASLWIALSMQSYSHIRNIIQIELSYISKFVNSKIHLRLAAYYKNAKVLETNRPITRELWRENALSLFSVFPSIQAVQLTDKLGQIRWSIKRENSELDDIKLRDFDHTKNIVNGTAIDIPKVSAVAVQFSQQNLDYVVYIPLVVDSKLAGYYVIFTEPRILFDQIFLAEEIPNYNLAIYDHSHDSNYELFSQGEIYSNYQKYLSVTSTLTGNIKLRILVWPKIEFIAEQRTILPKIVLFAGILFSLLLVIFIHLKQIAEGQAKQLKTINIDLENEIVNRQKAEHAREEMGKALLHGQKMQAIGTLAGGIAHDFNNILYAINGYVEMALEDIDKRSISHKNLEKVLQASKRARNLIANILILSRKDKEQFTEINLVGLIEDTLTLLRATIPTTIEIKTNVNQKPALIVGNYTQLQQVIINIITNAVDAIKTDGKIEISLDLLAPDDIMAAQFPLSDIDSYYMIRISDTGHGIEKDIIDRVFEPFFTTKEVGKGSGFGLAISHTIIKNHKGFIAVESEAEKGTTFFIVFPFRQQK